MKQYWQKNEQESLIVCKSTSLGDELESEGEREKGKDTENDHMCARNLMQYKIN